MVGDEGSSGEGSARLRSRRSPPKPSMMDMGRRSDSRHVQPSKRNRKVPKSRMAGRGRVTGTRHGTLERGFPDTWMGKKPVNMNSHWSSRDIQRRSGSLPARSHPGSGQGEAVSQAYLTVFGAPPSPVAIDVVALGIIRRVGRAGLVLFVCWALALVSVFIVLAHFILVPGFLVGGLVLAYLRFRTVRLVTRVHGVCPRCRVEQDFDPPSWGRTVGCPRCKNQVTLTWQDDSPAATVGPAAA